MTTKDEPELTLDDHYLKRHKAMKALSKADEAYREAGGEMPVQYASFWYTEINAVEAEYEHEA